MSEFEYVGCFFDYDLLSDAVKSIRNNPLCNQKIYPHVTFEYMPEKVKTELFGTEIKVTVTGYGNNGENEGLKVSLNSENETINRMIEKIEVPHITLAVSKSGFAVNTRYINFSDIPPFEITGHYGGYIKGQGVVL